MGYNTSSWNKLTKEIPQGSSLGPLLFNVVINDLFYVIKNVLFIYNYADDNKLSFIHQNSDILSLLFIQWFSYNCMTANPDKFQAIYIGNKTHAVNKSFKTDTTVINCEDNVTLLGVNIDFQLSFTEHTSEICEKASKQLAVLKRLRRFLQNMVK